MKKLVRSRPTWPAWGSAMSTTVSPMEMSKCPASSNTVQWGLGVVQRLQLSRCPPLLWRQLTERLLHPAKLDLEGPHRILI